MISSNDELPLVDGATKKRVSVDVLRRKIVMLFITDLDISYEELFVLIQIYNDTHQQRTHHNYEVVWLPVTDRRFPWDNSKEQAFNRLVSTMPWYSLYHPSLLEPAVMRYIREIWHFDKRPQLVVLDPQGKVVCPNALHMMWIWGSLAFPFTSNREEALWKDETWRLEFLVDEIDPVLLGWIRERRHVCLYGGEDIAWIRQFTTAMRRVSQEARVPLEMVYLGKSSQKDRVQQAITVIENEKLSAYWQEPVMMWFFWMRLESMWHSKMQQGRTIENDPIMQEVVTMLTLDSGNEGWAILGGWSLDMVKAHGRAMVECLGQFDNWKANVETEGFLPALAKALVPLQTMDPYCCNLILPDDIGRIKEPFVLNTALDERAKKKHRETFQMLQRFFKALHLDNTKILVDGATKKQVSADVLRRKNVMLFISDLDISAEELFVVITIYSDIRQRRTDHNYEVVWLPVTDRHFPWDNSKEQTFNRLASTMPWYSLYHPSLLEPAGVRYIREIWHFDKRPQLVVLDPQGKVVCPNALHMMWIWRSLAFPFTSNREKSLWKDETNWRLEFLVDEIDPVLLGWIREGRHVCLYGGEDIAWIRQFTTAMRRVSQEARVPLEMVYVGKSNPKDRVQQAITVIENEKLSAYWQEPVMMWFFWMRLESMWHSKMQQGRTIENDPIMQEVVTMLTLDSGNEGWAIVSRGSLDMVKANGRKMVECLGQFDKWKASVETEGFVPALANALVHGHYIWAK